MARSLGFRHRGFLSVGGGGVGGGGGSSGTGRGSDGGSGESVARVLKVGLYLRGFAFESLSAAAVWVWIMLEGVSVEEKIVVYSKRASSKYKVKGRT